MLIPIAWLRQYVDLPPDSQAIADRLASIGFPVEAIERRPNLSGIVVGKIAKLEKHPNADRLQIGTIDVAGSAPLHIATAATNVAQGQTIPVATIGAQLPELKIERRKMRGFESEGMMCSADELGLPAAWFEDGILQMDEDTPLGSDVVKLFALRDDVLDVEVTSNRPDALSMIGLARELAAAYGTELRLPVELQDTRVRVTSPGVSPERDGEGPRISLKSPDCTRFVAQRFTGVRVRPSPLWMRVRLALAGQRPIDNVVDISNYVMLEVGQPIHMYDAKAVAGNHLTVRDARSDESVVTLDDATHELTPGALVIADDRQVQCLAGLMGAKASAVNGATNSVIVEAANFTGARVRRMSAQLGFRTDASTRHEKSLAPILTDLGAARAASLLIAQGATAHAPHAFGEDIKEPPVIVFAVAEVKRLLGFALSEETIARHLQALGFSVLPGERDRLEITPPLWRRDVRISADIVEEIARMAGYDNVPSQLPVVPAHAIPSKQYHLERSIAHSLEALGYHEIISYALHGADLFERLRTAGVTPSAHSVEVRNPLSEDQRYLRYALGPGLLRAFARLREPYKMFEIGHTFALRSAIEETPMLGFAMSAKPTGEPAWTDQHFLRIKGDAQALIKRLTGTKPEATADQRTALHPGKTAVLMLDGREVAYVGQVDPRLTHAYDIELPVYVASVYLENIPEYRSPRYVPPSRLPSTYRDLALVLEPRIAARTVGEVIRRAIGPLCTDVRVFDEYRGPQVDEGRKSLAARIVLQRHDATITDEEADAAIEKALDALRVELNAVIRSS